MSAARAEDLHGATEQAFNKRDVDALVRLYADDACLLDQDGTAARGPAAIRNVWAGFVGLNGRMSMTTRYCVEAGDIALMSNAWQFTSEAMTFESVSSEVAVRGADGRWRYLIDHPTGGVVAE